MRDYLSRNQRPLSVVVTLIVVIVAVFAGLSYFSSGKQKHLHAYFSSTIGIYQGSSVRVLGVQIGTITKIKPEGTRVEVDMSYNANVKLPANDLSAEIVPPSIVSDRYLQIDPAYSSGPVAPNNVTIQLANTEVPVELDQIFGSLNDLDVALGPNGANKNGALSNLINVGAANLAGNGAEFNSTLHGFSEAISALSDSRDALFGTITQLQKFTTTLADDDGGVRAINGDLTSVSAQLAGERSDLGAALANLATALGELQSFVGDNKTTLTSDLHSLTTVTSGLVSEQQAIKEIIDEAPLGLQNLALAFNRSQGSCSPTGTDCSLGLLQTRTNINPTSLACTLLEGLGTKAGVPAAVLPNCATVTSASTNSSTSSSTATTNSNLGPLKFPLGDFTTPPTTSSLGHKSLQPDGSLPVVLTSPTLRDLLVEAGS